MAWATPDRTTLVSRVLGYVVNRTGEISALIWRAAQRAMAEAFSSAQLDLYANADTEVKQLFARTAEGEYLDRHGEYCAVPRLPAGKATATFAFSGTAGATQASGSSLTREDGIEYVTTALATVGGGGTGTVAIEAVEAGEDGNCDSGTVLTWASPSAGIDPTGAVTADVVNGRDEETDEDYSERIIDERARPSQGGATADYAKWAKAMTTVAVSRAWAVDYPTLPVGEVELYFMIDAGAGAEEVPDAGEIAAVDAELQPLKCGGTQLTVDAPATLDMDPAITLHVLAGYTMADVKVAMAASLAAFLARVELTGGATLIRNSQIRDALNVAGVDYYILTSLAGGSPTADVTLPAYTVAMVGTPVWS